MAWSSDLARTKTWGNETLTAADLHAQFDLIINWVMAALNGTTGHGHAGTQNDGKKLTSAAFSADCIVFAAIDDDGDFGLFTGDWSFNEIALVEDTAPATAAGEGKIYTKDSGTQPELFFREESNGDEVQLTRNGFVDGKIVQVVNTQTGAVATGTTAMPCDDTIPQITEGDEYMTLAITPTSATNKLRIDVVANVSHSAAATVTAALFQDATANALAAQMHYFAQVAELFPFAFTYYMAAGTTSATTFRVRVGATTGATTTFNGKSGGRYYGGVLMSSITITEIKA